jgi:hypothetical protein
MPKSNMALISLFQTLSEAQKKARAFGILASMALTLSQALVDLEKIASALETSHNR